MKVNGVMQVMIVTDSYVCFVQSWVLATVDKKQSVGNYTTSSIINNSSAMVKDENWCHWRSLRASHCW